VLTATAAAAAAAAATAWNGSRSSAFHRISYLIPRPARYNTVKTQQPAAAAAADADYHTTQSVTLGVTADQSGVRV